MMELAIGGIAFALGGGLMAGLGMWHQKRLERALQAERRDMRAERERMQARQDRLQEDLQFAKEQAATLRAEQDRGAAYDQGYLDGLQHGVDMTDVERMAYSLDQGQPGRLLRMDRHKKGRGAV